MADTDRGTRDDSISTIAPLKGLSPAATESAATEDVVRPRADDNALGLPEPVALDADELDFDSLDIPILTDRCTDDELESLTDANT
jgi:hypothetical protein